MSTRSETKRVGATPVNDQITIAKAPRGSVEVQVPASTSNLGSGFDCCGLALKLYLSVRATVDASSNKPCGVRTRGEGGDELNSSPSADNLIYRAMSLVAERENLRLPVMRLAVRNEIPLASGLGSSGAAIIAGIALCSALCKHELSNDTVLRYAAELEGHADNVAAALLGGLVINCIKDDGSVLAVKRLWPPDIKAVVVSPQLAVDTKHARFILPKSARRSDVVHNLQRVALFGAALERQAYDLFWEAMQDRLHQKHRAKLVPGLSQALATPRVPGLLGLALSGSGPSVLALASDRFAEIGQLIAACFHKHGLKTTVRVLEIDHLGLRTSIARAREPPSGLPFGR